MEGHWDPAWMEGWGCEGVRVCEGVLQCVKLNAIIHASKVPLVWLLRASLRVLLNQKHSLIK